MFGLTFCLSPISTDEKQRALCTGASFGFGSASAPFGCQVRNEASVPQAETMAQRDINTVLHAHDKEIMAIPGVVECLSMVAWFLGLGASNKSSP